LEKPRITVLNKIDLALGQDKNWTETGALEYLANNQTEKQENMVFVSATKKWGLPGLLHRTAELLADKTGYQAQITQI